MLFEHFLVMQSFLSLRTVVRAFLASLLFLPITSTSPVPYSDASMADIEKLRARGASEVFI